MSKLSFRARALDATKPMPIYLAEDLPDLPDFSAINRAVPQMPSGMQKEEECEHHLQRAICAGLIIPTPEVLDAPTKDFYDRVYPSNYKQPRQLIHMQPFTMEQDIPDYDMDSDDEKWLQTQTARLDLTPLKFEEMMDKLEKSSGQTVVTLSEAKALLKEDDELIIAVFDYWLNKRLKTQHPLIPSVRTEQRVGTAPNNPYLAFRRRTEKMQTRKNRKNDEASYEKMLKLRRDLVRAVTLLDLVKRREKCKREFVHLTVEVFEKRFQAGDYSGAVAAEAAASKAASAMPQRPAFTPIFHNHYNQSWADAVTSQAAAAHLTKSGLKDDSMPMRREKRQYKKRKHKSMNGGRGVDGLSSDEEGSVGGSTRPTTPDMEEQEDDGPFAFRRNRLCTYHKPLPTLGNWSWCSKEENGGADKRFRFALTSLSHPKKCVGFARRRMGRGGRVVLDRVGTDYDDFWRGLNFSIIEPTTPKEEQHTQEGSGVAAYYNISTSVSAATSTTLTAESRSTSLAGDFGHDRLSATVSAEVKAEPMATDEEEQVQEEVKQEDMVEFLRALRRDWLHFRPKTPPPDYEPPCHLSPPDPSPFASDAPPPFHMEVQPLDSALLLDQSPFITDLFELDRRWSDDDSSGTGPQEPLFEEFSGGGASEDDNLDSWRTVGVSSFTLTDAGGVASGGKRRIDWVKSEDEEVKGDEVGTTNGLISQFSFSADVPSANRGRNNKLQSYAYNSNTHPSNSGALSLLNSAQNVTLNSHSANNILDFPLTAAVDVEVKNPNGGAQAGGALPPSPATVATAPKATPNGGVRSNKSGIVMEVT